MSVSLSVSVVTFNPDLPVLGETLRSLAQSLRRAEQAGMLNAATVSFVDNGPGHGCAARLRDVAKQELSPDTPFEVLTGHGNVGYGRGHNIAILSSATEYHLVLNPDVRLEPDAIQEALKFMASHAAVVMLAPQVRGADGEVQFLCKRYPSVLSLLLRGFAPGAVKRLFRPLLDCYEMRDISREQPRLGIPIISGSFMFFRRAPIAALDGFSDDFFLYFEDFDLSLRAAKAGDIAFVPAVRIVHLGGHAARKGLAHITMFARSAITFFNRHGWRWV